MTEPMIVTQMTQIARVTDFPKVALPKIAPLLHWTIDPTTGRPVAHWMLNEKHPLSALSLTL